MRKTLGTFEGRALRTRVKLSFGVGALAVGLTLMILNVSGLIFPISEHPIAQRTHIHKTRLVRPSYDATREWLSRVDWNLPTDERLAAVNCIIAARIVHYWPDPKETDSYVMYSFLENWYMALLQRAEARLAELGLTKINIARIGRRDFGEILAKGVGLCGTTAFALVDYLGEQGQPAKILALGGHVVAYASVDGRNYIIDPDYGVFIPGVPSPPDRSMSKILAAYSGAGYSAKTLAVLEKIYARSSMKLLEPGRYQRSWKRLLIKASIIKWLVPIVLLGLGAVLVYRYTVAQPRRNVRIASIATP